MAERGQHQITGTGARLGLWACLLLGLLVVVFGVGILSTSWNAAQTAWIESRPIPVPVYTADFVSAGGKSDLELVLGEGSYEFVYETATVATDLPPVGSAGVFFADFSTGQHSGDSLGADTYVLSGPVKLTVSEITEQDNFLASMVAAGLKINAHFSFQQSPRGSPVNAGAPSRTSVAKKKIIILGKLEEVHFPPGAGNSKQTITILDLAPSDGDHGLSLGYSGRDPFAAEGSREERETSRASRPSAVPEHYRPSAPHSVH